MKKSLIAAAIALTGTSVAGTAFAAENPQQQPHGRFDNLIEAIAEHFDASVEEVKAIFEEQHQEVVKNRIEMEDARLDAAVADGTLTQEQADAIRVHREEMRTFMQSLEGMTQEERREALAAQHEANKQWAEENDIPANFLPQEGQHHQGPRGNHQGARPEFNSEESAE